ncbi:MAG: hypothetical protein AVO35_01390 [Candidatus Aegiribacteria sp. MLS_C]|nr:MAG: hypothetical protein AVO35_01390 [Candidatus Aegiribacteria sp. MLS_C]
MRGIKTCMDELLKRRVPLASLPTPVHYLERMSKELGVGLFVKRDDLTESVASGNKIRKMEYVLYQALEKGADTLVTCGGLQSNHCRAVAWIAARKGLRCFLILRGGKPSVPDGNLLLDSLLGAEMEFRTVEQFEDLTGLASECCSALQNKGRKPFFIPMGASTATGALGYVNMVGELAAAGDRFDHLYCAVGSGGTLAGTILGCRHFGLDTRIHGVAVCDDRATFEAELRRIGDEFSSWFGIEADLPGPSVRIDDGHVGIGYAMNTGEEFEELVRVARSEGLVLDPVYTLKAFLGMRDDILSGRVKTGEKVLFLHSGGHFGLMSTGFGVHSYTGW